MGKMKELLLEIEGEKDRAYYVQKAKRERGLSQEEIDYFLERVEDPRLLPYYACALKKLHDREEAVRFARNFEPCSQENDHAEA